MAWQQPVRFPPPQGLILGYFDSFENVSHRVLDSLKLCFLFPKILYTKYGLVMMGDSSLTSNLSLSKELISSTILPIGKIVDAFLFCIKKFMNWRGLGRNKCR